jgi:hypothetical protein
MVNLTKYDETTSTSTCATVVGYGKPNEVRRDDEYLYMRYSGWCMVNLTKYDETTSTSTCATVVGGMVNLTNTTREESAIAVIRHEAVDLCDTFKQRLDTNILTRVVTPSSRPRHFSDSPRPSVS